MKGSVDVDELEMSAASNVNGVLRCGDADWVHWLDE